MARPPKSGLDWFRHETDASTDEKIEAMRSLFGNDGYAFYFILLERIYRTAEQQIDLSDDANRKILCAKVGVKMSRFDQMVTAATARGLFDERAYLEHGILTSDAIRRRAARFLEKRTKPKPDNSADNVPNPAGFGVENPPETPPKSGNNVPALSRGEKNREEQNRARENAHENAELRNAEDLVDKAIPSYHLRPEIRSAVLAWIEIHENRLPSQHDCRAIQNRCDEHGVETVTLAIRRMGNAGQKPVTKLDEHIAAVTAKHARPVHAVEDVEAAEAARRADEAYANELRARRAKRNPINAT